MNLGLLFVPRLFRCLTESPLAAADVSRRAARTMGGFTLCQSCSRATKAAPPEAKPGEAPRPGARGRKVHRWTDAHASTSPFGRIRTRSSAEEQRYFSNRASGSHAPLGVDRLQASGQIVTCCAPTSARLGLERRPGQRQRKRPLSSVRLSETRRSRVFQSANERQQRSEQTRAPNCQPRLAGSPGRLLTWCVRQRTTTTPAS